MNFYLSFRQQKIKFTLKGIFVYSTFVYWILLLLLLLLQKAKMYDMANMYHVFLSSFMEEVLF